MQEHQKVSIAVLTKDQDDVELVNGTLRDAGHAAHCHWIETTEALGRLLHDNRIELIIHNCDTYKETIRQVIKQKDAYQPEVPVLAMQQSVDESHILDAMKQGACDLVSSSNRERLHTVVTRELRSFRIECALNSTLQSATTYRKQLFDYMEGSSSAIAYVQEGIITSANRAWLELFESASRDDVIGLPLMDNFLTESQAAVKGAIIATLKRKWQLGEKLVAKSRLSAAEPTTLELDFQLAEFDDGPHVQIRIAPPEKPPEEPTKLVHEALKRDPTTLFFHRAQFVERITKRLSRKPASGLHVLVYIKPDDFSRIADKVGLIASEEVLAVLAEEVRKRLHPRDVAGRFEGTTIMALLERGNERDAEAWARQLVEHIHDCDFEIDGKEIRLTCTIGVCAANGIFENMDELISAVAAAHKQGRKAGGNTTAMSEAKDEDTKLRRHDALWIKRINSALKDDRFRLAQLPIAGLRSESSGMCDMLVRMVDEQGDAIIPSEFLPAAERNNLMKTIDRWIITASIEFCATQNSERVFVRLSQQSLQDLTLVDWMKSEFEKRSVKPDKLCVQVAERTAARFIKPLTKMAEQFRQLGVGLALEHFAADQGRFQILDILKPDYIKIDGELMHSLMTDTAVQDSVRNVVAAANQRQIQTIAERVENANEMAVLFQIGIHYMQGHYVHEPEVVLQEHVDVVQTSLEAIARR
ncbi:MAG: EAL domain-containing protein [Gammaproteobacteria bacterium]|nr:EAL domain-containing protein [Gammaproteobacteria bacterium]